MERNHRLVGWPDSDSAILLPAALIPSGVLSLSLVIFLRAPLFQTPHKHKRFWMDMIHSNTMNLDRFVILGYVISNKNPLYLETEGILATGILSLVRTFTIHLSGVQPQRKERHIQC